MDSRQSRTITVKRVAPTKAGKVTKKQDVETPKIDEEVEDYNEPEPIEPQPQSETEPAKPQPQSAPEPAKPQPQSAPEPVKPQPQSAPEPVKPQPQSAPEPAKPQPKQESKEMSSKAYNTQSQSSNKGGSNKLIIIVLIVVAVALGYLLFGGGDTNNNQAAEAPATIEQTPQEQKSEPAPVKEAKQETPKKSEPVPEKKSEPAPVKKNDVNYDAGIKAYEAGNGLEAIKKFKASGSADSYYMLGVIYESGCGTVGKNAMMARQNFKKAANMGHAEAKAKLQ